MKKTTTKHQRHCRADKGFVCSCLPDISEMTQLFGLPEEEIPKNNPTLLEK